MAVCAGVLIPCGGFAANLQIDEGNFQFPANSVLLSEANNIGIHALGFDPATLNIHTANETTSSNGFMIGDVHAEWIAGNPFGNGVSQVFNFNIFEPAAEGGNSVLSDTLSITLTGQLPTANDLNNMSMDLHFRSGSLDETVLLPPLSGALSLTENGFFQFVDPSLPGQLVSDPNNPLSVSFRSDVPEPGTLQLGLLALLTLPLFNRSRVRR